MGETTNQIAADLRVERDSLDRNLRELEGRARQAMDWKAQYRKYPGPAVGLAFGVGVVMGLMTVPPDHASAGNGGHAAARAQPRRSTLVTPTPRDVERGDSGLASLARSLERHPALTAVQHHASDTLGRIAEALVALASAKVVAYIGHAVPGFVDEFDRRGPATRRA